MQSISQLFQFICCIGLICFPSACYSKRPVAAVDDSCNIRYAENGVPNFFKGANLSAPLDTDPEFRNLQAEKRYADIALYFLNWKRALFKLESPRDEFLVTNVHIDSLGQKHVQLAQVFNTIPVWGKELRVHLNRENQVFFIHGAYQPITADLITKALVSGEAAAKIVLQSRPNPAQWRIESVDTCIWAPDNTIQRLAYIVKVLNEPVHRQSCFVDAIDGGILRCITETNSGTRRIGNLIDVKGGLNNDQPHR